MPASALLALLLAAAATAGESPSHEERSTAGETRSHAEQPTPGEGTSHGEHSTPGEGTSHREHSTPGEGPSHQEHRAGVLGLPGSREASGTAWQPDAAPVYGWHATTGGFRFMLHGLLFAGWDEQGTRRGDGGPVSTNWAMAMVRHDLGGGELGGRLMLSAEPATVGTDGYPLLLQSGEAVGGRPLVDRQHPHDLFMELALLWDRPLADGLALELYAAPSGEPALGPPAFPHRASAFADPLAPLGHHWQDASHITFGVLTAGLFTRFAKLEASWFAGREPDEHRWGIDLRPLDSWSTRLSVNPWRWASAQASLAYLRSPEALEPDVDLYRFTASVQTATSLGGDDYLATTWVFGRNAPLRHEPATASALAEALLALGPWSLFTRLEWVEKTGHDLDLEPLDGTVLELPSVVLGAVRDLGRVGPVVPGLGFRAAANPLPSALEPTYGAAVGYGGLVFLRLRPPRLEGHAAPQGLRAARHSSARTAMVTSSQ